MVHNMNTYGGGDIELLVILTSTPNGGKSEVLFFFFKFLGVVWDWVHLVLRPLIGLLYQPRMIDDEYGAVCGMRIGRENRSTRRKPVTIATFSSTNPTWRDLDSNPGRRGGKPATKPLSYGTAMKLYLRTFKKRTIRIYEHCTAKLALVNLTLCFMKKYIQLTNIEIDTLWP
jgi:hypothetical protein